MSLRINNNVAAQAAHRNMQANDAGMSKSIERLSSGLRINSAADDAAGLVVSEQLRTQVSGLTQASRNTQDGVNMIKTTEKALDEITNQLRNIRDLTLHASNNKGNSQALAGDQAQINQATKAIQRISEQTEFAGIKLLATGSGNNINNRSFQIGANGGQTAAFSIDNASFDGITAGNLTADMSAAGLGIGTMGSAATASATGAVQYSGITDGSTTTLKFDVAFQKADGTLTPFSVTLDESNGDTLANAISAINTAIDPTGTGIFEARETNEKGVTTVNGGYLTIGVKSTATAEQTADSKVTVKTTFTAGDGVTGNAGFATAVTGSGTAGSAGSDINVEATNANFSNLLDTVDTAMKKVNGLRVHLGAFQKNNLESNLASISVAKENLSASESAIRDTDMADEMVSFTKSNILMQAGQAMMSQANQAPQGLLQLLR